MTRTTSTSVRTRNVLYLLIGGTALIVLTIFVLKHRPSLSYTPNTSTNNSLPSIAPMTFVVETTLADQEKGLGGTTSVPQDFGMLFAFYKNGNYGFWMKDMLVPIDIIWLSDTGTVLKIDASVAPSTYPQIFYPPVPVKYVLETAAGESARRGWNIGTDVHAPLPYGK